MQPAPALPIHPVVATDSAQTPAPASTPSIGTNALATLIASGAAIAGLAVYQWFELLAVRRGETPACAINATVNCATVWNSPFAGRIHDLLGMPVAALGIIYGVVALGLAGLLAVRSRQQGQAVDAYVAGIKLWAVAGALSCVTFGSASFQLGAVCLTCLGTYALTAVYVFGAFKLLPEPLWPDSAALLPGAGWCLVMAVPVYLALLGPGARTPHAPSEKLELSNATKTPSAGGGMSESDYVQAFAALDERERLYNSYARQQWTEKRPGDTSHWQVRTITGSADAPVKLVDFTDILCGHCRAFEQVEGELEKAAPPGSISFEARYFPLDGECNPQIKKAVGDGIRCMGAKVQLCLEGTPKFADVRHTLFSNQQTLTKEKIVELAVAGSGQSAETLLACVNSEETQRKLNEDIDYAMHFHIEGTPLVLVNGRESPPAPRFLLGMAIARGDVSLASVFGTYPPPPPPQ